MPTIPDTSGLTFSEPFAIYDPDSSCWRTSQGTFHWGSDEFSATWPQRGSMRNGQCFEHRTWEPATDELDCSSLPTPTARDGKTGEDKRGRSNGPDLFNALLPTPTANQPGGTAKQMLARKAKMKGGPRATVTDLRMVLELLPTPRAQNGEQRNSVAWRRPADLPQNLENALAIFLPTSALTPPLSIDGPPSWEDQPLPLWTTGS